MKSSHLLWLLGGQLSSATVHKLIVGTFGTLSLYTLEFDDATDTLSLLSNTTTTAASSWIALNHDKTTLYGTSFKADHPSFISYTIGANDSLVANDKTLRLGGDCANSSAAAIFVLADPHPPYTVYGTPFGSNAGCGAVMSVDTPTGALNSVVQDYAYGSNASTSAVHGLALSPDGSRLYSADDTGNAIWTHAVDSETGEVSLLQKLAAPSEGNDPRQVGVHPNGRWLFAIFEGSSELAQYAINESSGELLANSTRTWNLLTEGKNSTDFWASTLSISKNQKYLWATTRSRQSDSTGYISGYLLASDGSIGERLFLQETSTSGGTSSAVSASLFSDDYFALTDSSVGFVEVWKMQANITGAGVVSRVMLEDGGCCANEVWLS